MSFPNHSEIRDKIRLVGMEEGESDAKLASLALSFDFDCESSDTRDPGHFTDPFHFDETIAENIIRRAGRAP